MYRELIRKYRRKKLGLLLLVILLALPLFALGVYACFLAPSERPYSGDVTVFLIAAALMLTFVGITAGVFLHVPRDIRRMQDSIGCTGDEAFAELIAGCEKLPCKEERLLGGGYLFDMVSFRAYRLKDIAEVRRMPAEGTGSQTDYKVAVIFRDGAQCIIPSGHKEIDTLHRMICDAWQRSTGTA